MKPRFLLAALLSFACVTVARAELKLPAIFGNHMVLQQGKSAVWGKAEPGKTITVSLAGQEASAKSGSKGNWKVELPPLEAGGPYDLVVSGDGAVTLTDVLVGDVWLASGQSNMEFAMKTTHDADVQIPKADIPQIRFFTLDHATSAAPADDVKGSWKVCTPETVKDFSAVAYHFGKDIREALKIPIGLIKSAWGGTSGECWVPRDALDREPRFTKLLKDWDSNQEQIKGWTVGLPYELQLSDIRLTPKDENGKATPILLEKDKKGLGGNWNCSVNPGSTGAFAVKGKRPEGGIAATLSGLMKGMGWITLTGSLKADNSAVDLGEYGSIEFYAKGNGKYRMKLGQASIADYDYYSTDIFNAPADWKLMTYPISSLKQGGWGLPKAFTPDAVQSLVFTVEVPYNPEIASIVYNAMIAPLTSFGVKGVLWYQGESNAGRASDYQVLLSTLIKSWRTAWGKDLPFFIVQLPNYMERKSQPSESSWAELREAQLKTLSVPGTGVVTTIDLGEAGNIHPKNKTEVGRRLSLAALGQVYKKPVVCLGPLFDSLTVKGEKMLLKFKETGKGLSTRDGQPVTGFAVSNEDGEFYWANAKITGENTMEVWNDSVKKPVEVRYAWADNPDCNLMNEDGLPASPFRFSTEPETAEGGKDFFETWKSLDQTGVYVDSKGSTISFSMEKGPEKRQKAVKLTFTLDSGGYCGLWHNASYDLSKAGAIVFQAKTTLSGEVQVALKDKWNVQYVAKVSVPSEKWTEVKVPLSSFVKDPYYTPDNAELGHPMDLSKVNGMNFGPQATGTGEMWVGPVSVGEGSSE